MLANGVEVGKRIVEMEREDETAVPFGRLKAATCDGGGPKGIPCQPIDFCGRCLLFRRALSVGVTFLCATGIGPDPVDFEQWLLPLASGMSKQSLALKLAMAPDLWAPVAEVKNLLIPSTFA